MGSTNIFESNKRAVPPIKVVQAVNTILKNSFIIFPYNDLTTNNKE